jgi:alanine racemase
MQTTHLQINLKALENNYHIIRSFLREETEVCAVVKANAYGHGVLAIAGALTKMGVNRLGVATIEEAIELRLANIKAPIHLFNPCTPTEIAEAVKWQLIPFIHSTAELNLWQQQAHRQNTNINVHIKINSSMNRIGVEEANLLPLVNHCASLSHIQLTGLAMHLADADHLPGINTARHIDQFSRLAKAVQKQIDTPLTNHIANSATIGFWHNSEFDMVRPGLALYGFSPVTNMPSNHPYNKLQPIMTLKSQLISIRPVPAGSPISYNGTYITPQTTHIGVIPIGYSHGYPRQSATTQQVIINNNRYPVVGLVCMNQMMIDLGNTLTVSLYDEVTLFDPHLYPASMLADAAQTSIYPVLTSMSSRLQRYYQGD